MIQLLKNWSKNNKTAKADRLYKCFINNEKKWTIIIDKDEKYQGILYQSDIAGNISFEKIEDLKDQYSNRPTIAYIDDYDVLQGYANAIFDNQKDVLVVPVIKDEKVVFVYEKKVYDVNAEERMMLLQYNIIQQLGYSLGQYLKEQGINEVNIIGASMPLVSLYNDLTGNGVEIKHIVDHKYIHLGKAKSCGWSDMSIEDWMTADSNIIIYISTQDILYNNLKKKGIAESRIVLLCDLISSLYNRVTSCAGAVALLQKCVDAGAHIRYFRLPWVDDILQKNNDEKYLYYENVIPVTYRKEFEQHKPLIKKLIGINTGDNDIKDNIIDLNVPITRSKDRFKMEDFQSKYFNVVSGMRVTVDQPSDAAHAIHIFGSSNAFGKYVRDDFTIASNLQRLCNFQHQDYIVYNHGIPAIQNQGNIISVYEIVASCDNIKKDDIVVILGRNEDMEYDLQKAGIPVYDCSGIVQRPRVYENIFVDRMHMNESGDFLLSQEIYNKCFDGSSHDRVSLSNVKIPDKEYKWTEMTKDEIKQEKEMEAYLRSLPDNDSCNNGAIVINCNPFTKGHRHLIEQSARQVDTLYLFVVEENRSLFPFEDRYELVKANTGDIPNVVVLKSGKFIISSLTFPEYFLKEDKQDITIDATGDLVIFCEKIAPRLNIKKRFAGNEPEDKITDQYNKEMSEILPRYGIEFVEIPRAEKDGSVISASVVRKYLKEGNLEKAKPLVPKKTYDYLKKFYADHFDVIVGWTDRKKEIDKKNTDTKA